MRSEKRVLLVKTRLVASSLLVADCTRLRGALQEGDNLLPSLKQGYRTAELGCGEPWFVKGTLASQNRNQKDY